MTRLDCAIRLLKLLFINENHVTIDQIEAVARAIMELGRSEGADVK